MLLATPISVTPGDAERALYRERGDDRSRGVLSSMLAVVAAPAGTVSGTVLFTLTGVPTAAALPTDTQDIGLHILLSAALTDGTPLTATLLPLSITLRYSDVAWQDAQVSGEGTLRLWRYDAFSLTW